MRDVLRLIRPKHWLKNVLVLLPLVFSGRVSDIAALGSATAAFAAFCMLASAVYVLNDLMDADSDARHPTKCERPIASGRVSKRTAWGISAGLIAIAFLFHLLTGNPASAWILLAYLAMNAAYSLGLKAVPLVDIVILAAGYLVRVYYGGMACGVEVSIWLYLTILAASFYMGLGKRRGELDRQGAASRKVLQRYSRDFLDKNMYLFLALANVFYALWAQGRSGTMLATVPLVMVMSMRYSLDVEGASDGDPMEVVLGDRPLLALGATYLVLVAALLYLA